MWKLGYMIKCLWCSFFGKNIPIETMQPSMIIEDEANRIREMITKCKRIEETFPILDILADLSVIWSHSFQGIAAHDSLVLALYNKQLDIEKSQ